MYQNVLGYASVTMLKDCRLYDAYGGLQVSVGNFVHVHSEQSLKDLQSNCPGIFFRQSTVGFQVFSKVQVLAVLHANIEPALVLVPTI